MKNLLRLFLVIFLAVACPAPAFSSCMSLESVFDVNGGHNVLLVEIVRFREPEKVARIPEMKKGREMLDISIAAEIRVLKVYKGSESLTGISTATVRLRCAGDEYKGALMSQDGFCREAGNNNYPFIEGQRFLLFSHDERLEISDGDLCDVGVFCVDSGRGLWGCDPLEVLENGLEKYWAK